MWRSLTAAKAITPHPNPPAEDSSVVEHDPLLGAVSLMGWATSW